MSKFTDLTQRNISRTIEFFREQPRLSIVLGLLIVTLWVITVIRITLVNTPVEQLNQPLAMAAENLPLSSNWYTITVKPGDNLANIFKRLKISSKQLQAILAIGQTVNALTNLKPGQQLKLLISQDHQLGRLITSLNATTTLIITRNQLGFHARILQKPLEQRLVFTQATIHHSFYKAARRAGLTNQQILQFNNIFDDRIDFTRSLRSGDYFNVLYKSYYIDGKRVKNGNIVAAEFKNRGKIYKAIRFTYPKDHTGYYTPDGKSLQISIWRTPVKYKYISSYFGKHRFHPILHIFRPHKGIDYAAYYNTPVKAAGDGTITYISRKGSYGRVVFLRHDKRYSTRYAHLARFAKGLKRGSHVHQGQVIGYVGMSGLATGPHLHYEIRVNGIARNPLTVSLPNAKSIPSAYIAVFKARAQRLIGQIALHQQNQLATNRNSNTKSS